MRVRRLIVVVTATVALVLGITGPAAAGKTPKLKVRLIEFDVKPARIYPDAGKTKVVAQNKGTEEHELVIVRGDDPAALPANPDGSVNEDELAEDDVVGEIEDVKRKKTKSKTFKLSAGEYIFFCNIVDEEEDGTIVSHFAEGMYTVVTPS